MAAGAGPGAGRSSPWRSWRPIPAGVSLASATPAAGKTTFGLRVAWEMLMRRPGQPGGGDRPDHSHLPAVGGRRGAATESTREPNRPNSDGPETSDFHGVTVTYQTRWRPGREFADAARRPTPGDRRRTASR